MSIVQKHHEKKTEVLLVIGPMPFSWKTIKPYLNRPHLKLFFIDGGSSHLMKFKKYCPSLVMAPNLIGDGDSSKIKMTKEKRGQNSSDLAFFLQSLKRKKSPYQLAFFGFTGGRLDHQLFVLGEVYHFINTKKMAQNSPEVCFENKIHFIYPGVTTLDINGLFSIASLEEAKTKVTGQCKYQCRDEKILPLLSSRGLSNIGFGRIEFQTNKILMIIYP